LVQAVLDTGARVVLVLVDGRPAAIPDLAARIPAILQAWLPGEEGGPAVAEILFGQVNPSGKLPVTVPRSVGQVPIYYRHKPSAGRSYPYNNSVDESAQPWFPFGHGLSYTTYEYSDLTFSPSPVSPTGEVAIRLTVTNTGPRAGAEVVQLYVRDVVGSVTRPVKELKGFHRLDDLAPGESRVVTFTLAVPQLAFYNRAMEYVVEPGVVELMIGRSAADIRLTGQFEIAGPVTPIIRKVFFSQSAEQ
jgi:beta-glucosidase